MLSGSSNNLLDSVNEFWLIASRRCISEHRLRKIIGTDEQIVCDVLACGSWLLAPGLCNAQSVTYQLRVQQRSRRH